MCLCVCADPSHDLADHSVPGAIGALDETSVLVVAYESDLVAEVQVIGQHLGQLHAVALEAPIATQHPLRGVLLLQHEERRLLNTHVQYTY